LENKTWLDDYYLRFFNPGTGEKSDVVFAMQLCGEWLAKQHGLEGVFRPERMIRALETIKRTCVAATRLGTLHQATPEGSPVVPSTHEGRTYPAAYVSMRAPIYLGLNYMYAGQVEFGLEVIRRAMHNYVCNQGFTWYGAASYDGLTGKFMAGTEYVYPAFLWAVLGAMEGKDLTAPAQRGGLADRVIRAAIEKGSSDKDNR